jgi:phosphoglycolate phosphatase
MKYKAVLFDLDGTLLNTLEDIGDSMNAVLRRLQFPAHNLEVYKYFVGDGVYALARRALPEEHRSDEDLINRCVAAMREEYGKNWAYKTHPYEGVQELLAGLSSRSIRTAVLSNKPDDFTKMMVTKLLPQHRFEQVYGERTNVPRKPDPVTALEIAVNMQIPTDKFLYLGDTNIDMITASAAGMYPVGALWGFRTGEELMAGGAKALIEYPSDLLKLL